MEITVSRHFLSWLHDAAISLAFTTYQTNRLFLIGLKPDGALSAFERHFDRPMGLHAAADRLYMTTRWQIWELANALPPGEQHRGYDRVYVPRRSHTTGDLDAHDVALDAAGRIVFVNTPQGVAVFAGDTSVVLAELLQARWRTSLPAVGDRLRILPRPSPTTTCACSPRPTSRSTRLTSAERNTAYDAFVAGAVVVTLPGDHPRSRYTAALYESVGITDGIAATPDAYVATALRSPMTPRRAPRCGRASARQRRRCSRARSRSASWKRRSRT